MAFGKKSNWDVVNKQKFGENAATRDVQNEQTLARGDKPTVTNLIPRLIMATVFSILFTVLAYFAGTVILIFMQGGVHLAEGNSLVGFSADLDIIRYDLRLLGGTVMTFLVASAILYERLVVGWKSENSMADTTDINQHKNDQHLMLIEELQRDLDWFPDVGAHSSIQMTSMLSHVMLSNKGLKSIDVAKRHKKDGVDAEGVPYYKGEIMRDSEGYAMLTKEKLIDEAFGQELFSASNIPKTEKEVREAFDVRKTPYNPPIEGEERKKKDKKELERVYRDKLPYDTVRDLINDDWEFPEYEVQRPAGAYLVDTAPSNTMVLAITRAGKGQTVIEPTIDMWTREKRQNNIVVNDPKGELLVKFYVPATVRGYEIVQFNLMNDIKTDIYNPLGFAANFAREGDFTKAATFIENIGDVFFPKDGADDPMWPNAANNAFKRTAFGLIDYYLEEEKQLRREAEIDGMSEKVLAQKLDDMWGKVSLYNAYQLFVILSSKKSTDEEKIKIDDDEVVKEKDFLTLFFDATAKLPSNSMRNLVANTDRSLRAMSGSDKTIASVYGIALTAMSFFTDPTISTLTSGKPSQNFDAQGLSFPRRIGVRFAPEWLKKRPMAGMQAVWTAYKDKDFTDQYDDEHFGHTQLVDRTGWARYYFDGIFPERKAYVQLDIKNPDTGALLKTFYFELELTYKTSLNGRSYVKDPILDEKIIKDGVLKEMKRRKDGSFVYSETQVVRRYRNLTEDDPKEKQIKVPVFSQKTVNYTERPKVVFFITPPHLMSYAKLILILIKQMVDVNFEGSYMTKSDQKPLYKTRYMLDELGNLQSEGNGIPSLQTMLSIGLGQDQQFTLILQTLQQLRDVYGESVDKIIQGNIANIVFLKSTDDAMLETLEKLSGKTHESLIEQKTITRDNERVMNKTEGRISYTMSTKERAVIQFNDMLFIPERNSMVFRVGRSPIWNRNKTILPMSWRLFKDTIKRPGVKYSLQTNPTLSTALDFDIRKNQPDFYNMLNKRIDQAKQVDNIRARYMDVYDYSEGDMAKLDPDVLSDDLMISINETLYGTGIDGHEVGPWVDKGYETKEEWVEAMRELESQHEEELINVSIDNDELLDDMAEHEEHESEANLKVHADGRISKRMLVNASGTVVMELQQVLSFAYDECKQHFGRSLDYLYNPQTHELISSSNGTVFVENLTSADEQAFNDAVTEQNSTVYSEETEFNQTGVTRYRVTPAFIKHLASLSDWKPLAGGRFENEVAKAYDRLKT